MALVQTLLHSHSIQITPSLSNQQHLRKNAESILPEGVHGNSGYNKCDEKNKLKKLLQLYNNTITHKVVNP